MVCESKQFDVPKQVNSQRRRHEHVWQALCLSKAQSDILLELSRRRSPLRDLIFGAWPFAIHICFGNFVTKWIMQKNQQVCNLITNTQSDEVEVDAVFEISHLQNGGGSNFLLSMQR